MEKVISKQHTIKKRLDYLLYMSVFIFLSIQKQTTPINKKNKVSTRKISASANIIPEPWFILSIKELKQAQAKTTATEINITASVFNITEYVFFILKYSGMKRETKNARC
jgi:hypothetical protein